MSFMIKVIVKLGMDRYEFLEFASVTYLYDV